MLLVIYMLLVLITGISALVSGAIYAGIAGIVGPTMCWWAGAGLKGSLSVGTDSQKIGGILAAVLFFSIGFGVVQHSGFWVGIYGYDIHGAVWCLIGFATGFISATREQVISPAINRSQK